LAAFLLGGCGSRVSEEKLIGSWQVSGSTQPRVILTIHSNRWYTMRISGLPGVASGRWSLNRAHLKTSLTNFTAYQMTAPAGFFGTNEERYTITSLTERTLVLRSGILGESLSFNRTDFIQDN
jgi:hypothetical protein